MDNENMNELEFLKMLQALAESIPDDEQSDNSGPTVVDADDSPREPRRSAGDLRIVSIKEAEFLVDTRMHFGMSSYGVKITDYITDPRNHVCGDPDEYHNLISSFLRLGDYYNAHRICAYALKIFPYNVDILANAIRAACEDVDSSIVDCHLAAAERIDKKFWNWRLFLFSIKAYRNRMCQCPPDMIDQYYQKAIDLTHEYQRYIPWDERGYNQMAELLLLANDVAGARKVLDKAIFQGYEDANGRVRTLIAPQCCVTMLNEVLEDTAEYDIIKDVAMKGIQFTAQEQPSSRIGYFVHRLAMAMDAELVKDNYRSKSDIEATLRMYQCAYDLNDDRASYSNTIEIRYAILSQNKQNPVVDMPLVKRKLTRKADSE